MRISDIEFLNDPNGVVGSHFIYLYDSGCLKRHIKHGMAAHAEARHFGVIRTVIDEFNHNLFSPNVFHDQVFVICDIDDRRPSEFKSDQPKILKKNNDAIRAEITAEDLSKSKRRKPVNLDECLQSIAHGGTNSFCFILHKNHRITKSRYWQVALKQCILIEEESVTESSLERLFNFFVERNDLSNIDPGIRGSALQKLADGLSKNVPALQELQADIDNLLLTPNSYEQNEGKLQQERGDLLNEGLNNLLEHPNFGNTHRLLTVLDDLKLSRHRSNEEILFAVYFETAKIAEGSDKRYSFNWTKNGSKRAITWPQVAWVLNLLSNERSLLHGPCIPAYERLLRGFLAMRDYKSVLSKAGGWRRRFGRIRHHEGDTPLSEIRKRIISTTVERLREVKDDSALAAMMSKELHSVLEQAAARLRNKAADSAPKEDEVEDHISV